MGIDFACSQLLKRYMQYIAVCPTYSKMSHQTEESNSSKEHAWVLLIGQSRNHTWTVFMNCQTQQLDVSNM
jgi:Gpi18-like mannosyltransferase